jgi:hypothetical protein
MLVILAAVGCYTQRPLVTPVPEPGSRIVAQLTDVGVVEMSNAIGSGAIQVEGLIVKADATAWSMNLLRVDHRGTGSIAWNRELVTFPRSVLTGVSEKRLDRRKSWVAGGILVAGAYLAARLLGSAGADSSRDGSPVPPSLRVIR